MYVCMYVGGRHVCRHQWHIVFGLHLAILGISWGGGALDAFFGVKV